MKWYEILWQLPQWIVGYLYLVLKEDKLLDGFIFNGAKYYIIDGQRGSVTFCKDYIFLSRIAQHSDKTIKHEYGHTIQSKYLGWLYLIIVGLSSIIWAFIHSNFKTGKPYDWWFTEKWADKLGNV